MNDYAATNNLRTWPERNTPKGTLCGDCPHLVASERVGFFPEILDYFCGHYDLSEIGTNDPSPWIGFVDVRPAWCPLLDPTLSEPRIGRRTGE